MTPSPPDPGGQSRRGLHGVVGGEEACLIAPGAECVPDFQGYTFFPSWLVRKPTALIFLPPLYLSP